MEEPDVFLFHKNSLAGGIPRTPDGTPAPCPWARNVPVRRLPETGAERRGRNARRIAHTGHAATPSRSIRRDHASVPSLARSSTARMSSSSAGSPKPGVLLPLRGSSSCVTRDPAASDSAKPAPKRLEWP